MSTSIDMHLEENSENEEPQNEEDMLRKYTVESNWSKVVDMYKEDRKYHEININKSRGTALHVAVSESEDEIVRELVDAIIEHEQNQGLKLTNNRGDTPLHIAAAKGFVRICKYIIGEKMERSYLITIRNKRGETPLFLAALHGKRHAFASISKLYKEPRTLFYRNQDLIRNDGDSILHCAIRRDFFELALTIMKKYPELAETQNNDGFSPLKLLATRPSAFPSGISLTWRQKIIYECTRVKDFDAEKALNSYLGPEETSESGHPILQWLADKFGINATVKIKRKHKLCCQLLEVFMEKPFERYLGSGGQPFDKGMDFYFARKKETDQESEEKKKEAGKIEEDEEIDEIDRKETPVLTAARNGIVEMVDVLMKKVPSVVHETTSDKKNILLVAVTNRQSKIIAKLQKLLAEKQMVWYNLTKGVDNKENTMLHLVAKKSRIDKTWHIPGSAMRMMWDIRWFEYIQSLLPENYIFRSNKFEKTPAEIFNISHKELVKEGSEWLKDTSESCSVVAALIAGVSYATSSNVPGGNNDKGEAPLEGQPAFDAYSMASLIGLFFSVSALIMFLSILTSRKQARDFRMSLPLKLLLGLSSLFISIAALFVSFCSGNFFALRDKYRQILFPIYAATFLPVTFYAMVQFPLYIDLMKVLLKGVPQSSDKGGNL